MKLEARQRLEASGYSSREVLALWHHLNEVCFDSSLKQPLIAVEDNESLLVRYDDFVEDYKVAHADVKPDGAFVEGMVLWDSIRKRAVIILNKGITTAKDLMLILAHEMVHQALAEKYGYNQMCRIGHGPRFKAYASKVARYPKLYLTGPDFSPIVPNIKGSSVAKQLTPKQKQLDINGDGKIDSTDLKRLRNGEKPKQSTTQSTTQSTKEAKMAKVTSKANIVNATNRLRSTESRKVTSAYKGAQDYTWFRYTGDDVKFSTKAGFEAVLSKNMLFGVRKSKRIGKFRLAMAHLGPTKVFRIGSDAAQYLGKHCKPAPLPK